MARRSMVNCLDDAQAISILLNLDPRSAVRVQASSKDGIFAKAAISGTIWQTHAERTFELRGEDALLGPAETSAGAVPKAASSGGGGYAGKAVTEAGSGPAIMAAFSQWYAAARDAGLGDVCANGRCVPGIWLASWQKVCKFAGQQRLQSRVQLRGPADADALALVESSCFRLAPELLGMWKICDGQKCAWDPQLASVVGLDEAEDDVCTAGDGSAGIFGGYAVYDHEINVHFLPIRTALKVSKFIKERFLDRQLGPQASPKLIFACDTGLRKNFFVDAKTGEVQVCGLSRGGAHIEHATPKLVDERRSNLLRWFQTFASRLEDDVYPVLPLRPEQGPRTMGICLCPCKSPADAPSVAVSTCKVTNFVEVVCGAEYMPELGRGWTYSLSLRLLGSASERGFEQCQLTTRTWMIADEGRAPEAVHGEGVIGLFPILKDGGWLLNGESDPHGQYMQAGGGRSGEVLPGAFRYQSQTGPSERMKGTFGGFITFVPGTKRKPTGRKFDVQLEFFSLCVPDFIY